MVIALGLEHSRQAVEAQRAVTNMTNELLKSKPCAAEKRHRKQGDRCKNDDSR